ncbi:MAG: hypothetical protein R2731_12095 [Nocardioides sp.]
MAPYLRQAVVVVHGMGEQLPLDTLTRFIDTALAPDDEGRRVYYSRPESVTGSFESRRFLAPPATVGGEPRPQTEFFEYHWADKMQGNRLDDLWPTTRRMLLQPPTRVPYGLKGVWALAWLLVLLAVWMVAFGPWRGLLGGDGDLVPRLVGALLSGGLAVGAVSYVVTRVLPQWLTGSFVDVVRYLDTSPRSYAVRRDIRKGLVELLEGLHHPSGPSYDRIVVVAHSLGGYLAYDAIAYLWGRMNSATAHDGVDRPDLGGLQALEEAASALPLEDGLVADDARVTAYQRAQRGLWLGARAQGNPWLVTDLVTCGTPMYFADQLMRGRGRRSFAARKLSRELPTCPPHNEEGEGNNIHATARFFSWEKKTWETVAKKRRLVHRRVLYEGAPFAVVRWTNLFFPVRAGFFGDWFGGPLAPLFGPGIRDVPVTGNTRGHPGTTWLRHRRFRRPRTPTTSRSPTTTPTTPPPPGCAAGWTSRRPGCARTPSRQWSGPMSRRWRRSTRSRGSGPTGSPAEAGRLLWPAPGGRLL